LIAEAAINAERIHKPIKKSQGVLFHEAKQGRKIVDNGGLRQFGLFDGRYDRAAADCIRHV
jgi:hypothetical protein